MATLMRGSLLTNSMRDCALTCLVIAVLGDPPGFSLENHEFAHRLDLQHDLGESALNQSIQTEGFGTLTDCNNARDSFDRSLSAHYNNSQLDSVMRRDHY